MKNFALATATVALMFGASAHAYTTGTFSNGFVVPNVIHNGPADTTVVGIMKMANTYTGKAVHWTFFDQNSSHVTDDCFTMSENDYHSFVWADNGRFLDGKRGYLVFSFSDSPTCSLTNKAAPPTMSGGISGSASQLNLVNRNVAYVPVIDGPITYGPANVNITQLGPHSVVRVAGAAQITGPGYSRNPLMNMRYAIDEKMLGQDTNIVVWSTGDHRGTYVINMFDDNQNRKALNFALKHAELDVVNPKNDIPGRPSYFTHGFIQWGPVDTGVPADFFAMGGVGPALAQGPGSVFAYSIIDTPVSDGVQTVLGSYMIRP